MRAYQIAQGSIPDDQVLKFNIPLNPTNRYDEVIEPRTKKSKASEKYVKKHKIKEHGPTKSEPIVFDEVMSLVFSNYDDTNRHVIEEMRSELTKSQ